MMDFIDGLEIELEREAYCANDKIRGCLHISCMSNVKIRGINVTLKGKVQVQWKVVKKGAIYTVKNCHVLMDSKKMIWGKDHSDFSDDLAVLTQGAHQIDFIFDLDDLDFPCSFESRLGTIRYYLYAVVDIPYASPPQAIKYFSLLGRSTDCPPPEWLVPISLERHSQNMCVACSHGPLSLSVALSRTAFCCGEKIPVQMEVSNGVSFKVWPVIQLLQHVDYVLEKTGFGVRKDTTVVVWEYKGPQVPKNSNLTLDNLGQVLQVPVMPPTIRSSSCDIIQIEYRLKIALGSQKWGEPLHLTIPLLITPYSTSNQNSAITMKAAIKTVEGGNYISPELQAGQVYDGTEGGETVIFQPKYACVPHAHVMIRNDSSTSTKSMANNTNMAVRYKTEEIEFPASMLTSV